MKNTIFLLIFCVVTAFFCPSLANAAFWYIDRDAKGANTGNSWANAWTSFSRVVWGSGGVQAGDTLFISGGVTSKTYNEMWSVGADGRSGAPITIKVGQDSGHSGHVIFDFDSRGDSGAGSAIGLAGRSHIVISGEVNKEIHLHVRNLRNINDRMQATAIGGVGTAASHILVEYVGVSNCNNGIYFSYPSDVEIRHSKVTVRGDCGVGLVASSGGWDSYRVHHNEITAMVSWGGPDGISCSHGVSIYNNVFRVARVDHKTSDQHPDQIQCTGNNVKVYNNDFVDIGDSGFDFDTWSNTTPHDVWIFNNVFRIVTAVDPYPDYIRVYTSNGKMTSITNFKIFSNLFIDNNAGGMKWPTIRIATVAGVSGSDNELKNNIFYNCGDGSQYFPLIAVDGPSGSFSFDGNLYYHPSGSSYVQVYGNKYPSSQWVSSNEPKGKTGAPSFVLYRPYDPNNDLRLSSADRVAINAGVDLSRYTTTDKNGLSRLAGFDIGPYEAVGGPPPLAPPQGLRIF